MNIEKRIYNADQAKLVLENEAYLQVYQDLNAEIVDQWKKSPARDEEGREKLWLMLSMLSKIQTMLQTSLETGKLARLEIEHQRSMAERAKNLLGLN